jgi:DNA-binding response OmpR family regulator
VEITYDGQIALEKINSIRYDLIITDMMLPNVSGLELLSKIKQSTQNLFVPVVVLSSLSSPDLIVAAFAAGVSDYITKPFSIKVVIARITQFLGNIPIMGTNLPSSAIPGKL